MDWRHRGGRAAARDAGAAAPAPPPRYFEGAAPGLAALLQGLGEERTHAVLDLGAASDLSLQVYGRFARWIRFADLFGEPWPESGLAPGLEALLAKPDHPYDLVFAWDILDRLFADDRPALVQRLAATTAPEARLHLVTRASDQATPTPVRFALLGEDRIRYEPTGNVHVPASRLLPADVARLLAPFHVVHAFTLKTGFREYVAVRRPPQSGEWRP